MGLDLNGSNAIEDIECWRRVSALLDLDLRRYFIGEDACDKNRREGRLRVSDVMNN